ncbi:MAG: copper transporter [Acidimicrobiia bacterium]
MINFRFHLVSLVAVFLALAVGVVMGSTVIDRAIVDGLHSQINRIEAKADKAEADNADLRSEGRRLDDVVQAELPHAVGNRLQGQSVAVLAVDGVNEGAVRSTVELARQAGAQSTGILWVTDKFASSAHADAQLAPLLADAGITGEGNARTTTLAALAGLVAAGSGAEAQPSPEPLVRSLLQKGFLRYEAVGDQPSGFSSAKYPTAASRAIVVGGGGQKLAAKEGLAAITSALHRAGVATVAAEAAPDDDPPSERGSEVAVVHDDHDLADTVSTVDDLERPEGRLAAVLALADLGDGRVGRYGYGAGAPRVVPERAAS